MKNIIIQTKGSKYIIFDLQNERQVGEIIETLEEANLILEFLESLTED